MTWSDRIATWITEKELTDGRESFDPAHDLLHLRRVVHWAEKLAREEGACIDVVVPAAWMHDWINLPKNHPDRAKASRMSAEKACEKLRAEGYPKQHLPAIFHAIEAHSFSAEIAPRTLEAKIVQDADRLDGIGAIGIARCLATAGVLRRPFYRSEDPFCESRSPDDQLWTIDHFYQKLFRTAQTLQTASAQREGARRLQRMKDFLEGLGEEI